MTDGGLAVTSRTAERPRRADARRNVAALLEAASSVFATVGVDASAKEITDAAGVGIGTLYRHFPRRADLIVAVLQQEVDACLDAVRGVRQDEEPMAALAAWIEPFMAFVSTKRGLARALHSDDPALEGLPDRLLERLQPPLQGLLDHAVAAGVVRHGVSAREVLTAIALLSQPVPGLEPDFNRRMAGLLIDGLRERSGAEPADRS